MPRKAAPNSQYRVPIHLNNIYRYASTQPFQVDPDTGKKTYHHVHWVLLMMLISLFPTRIIFLRHFLSQIKRFSEARKKGCPAIAS